MVEATENKARALTGKVISDRMNKSIVVLVERRIKHPTYGKYVKRSTKLHVHDEENSASIGDVVRIREGRPISKMKCWRLVEIVDKAIVIQGQPQADSSETVAETI